MSEDLASELGRNIPLFEMIQTLRQELKASIEVARGDSLKLELQEVEIELQVAISREAQAGGKISFWVLEAGGEGKRGSVQAHVIKLKLKPFHGSVGGRTLVDAQGTGSVK